MSEHTPGPWRVAEHLAGDGYHFIEPVAGGVPVAQLPHSEWKIPGSRPFREAEANARLIAAAPDLLAYAFLEKRLEEFDCPHDAEHQCRCGNAHDEMIAEARNLRERAIAKAEGR